MIGYRKRYDLKPSAAARAVAADPVIGGHWKPGRVLVFACDPEGAGEELHEGRERRIPGPREAADAELTGDPELARRHAEERGDYDLPRFPFGFQPLAAWERETSVQAPPFPSEFTREIQGEPLTPEGLEDGRRAAWEYANRPPRRGGGKRG